MTSPDEPGWVLLAVVTTPPALAWAFLRRSRSALALACGLLACAGSGAIAGKVRTGLMAAPVLHEEIGPVRIEGTTLTGDGWTVTVAQGWTVRSGPRSGDYQIIRGPQ